MYSFMRFDQQGILLHRIIFIVLVIPFQRFFIKIMGVKSIGLWLFIFSLILFVILQIKPIQVGLKNSITRIFSTKIFQKYLFSFLCLENYACSPKGCWSIGILCYLFIFSFFAQFIFQDYFQLSLYTFIYTIFIIHISLRNSSLFSSTPVSWEKTLRMIESSLKMEKELANKINRDFDFLYMASARANIWSAFKYVKDSIKSCFSSPSRPPEQTPEVMDGLGRIAVGTAGLVVGTGATVYVNERINIGQEQIARSNRESQERIARSNIESQERIARSNIESQERIAAEQLEMARGQQRFDMYKELDRSSKEQIDQYNLMIKDARGKDKMNLLSKRDDLVRRRHEFLDEISSSSGESTPKSAKGLALLLDNKSSLKINSPEEWDVYSSLLFSLRALL